MILPMLVKDYNPVFMDIKHAVELNPVRFMQLGRLAMIFRLPFYRFISTNHFNYSAKPCRCVC